MCWFCTLGPDVFFCIINVCQVIMKITVIVIVNKKKYSPTNEELVKAVVGLYYYFRAFDILSVVFTTLKSNAKNSSSNHFVLFR